MANRSVSGIRKGKDEYHGYCHTCDADIRCQLQQHCAKKNTKEATKHVPDKNNPKFLFTASTAAGSSSSSSAPKSIGLFTFWRSKP